MSKASVFTQKQEIIDKIFADLNGIYMPDSILRKELTLQLILKLSVEDLNKLYTVVNSRNK